MDGLLILALIAWAIAQGRKRKKKPQTQAASITQKEDGNRHRAERRARLQKELEKRKAQLAEEKKKPIVHSEGEATAAYPPMEEPFRGSMEADSTEGECLCEPELGHARVEETMPESVYAGEIGRESLVDFSAHGVMQGVVMSEILARPAQRVRRYSYKGWKNNG